MPATTQDHSSPTSDGVSIYLYTRLIDETMCPKESAWYLITPTSESGEDLSPVFSDVPLPEDGFDIWFTGRAVIGSKLYLIGGCCREWGGPTAYYSAVRCLDTSQSPSQGWTTISSLPLGFVIGHTAVSAPWIYVFGCTQEPQGEPQYDNLFPSPWGYAINVDNPEETFPMPEPHPEAFIDMCAVLEEGLLIYEGDNDTLLLFNLKDRSYSVYQMPDIIPTNESFSACTYSCGIFYCYDCAGFILAYDTVHRVRLPTYEIQPEWNEMFEADVSLPRLFSASNGKIGLLLYHCVSIGFMSVIYVELSMLYGDSVEMVVHKTRKFHLRGDGKIDIVPCYPCRDEIDKLDERQQKKSKKNISRKKKGKRRKKQEQPYLHHYK